MSLVDDFYFYRTIVYSPESLKTFFYLSEVKIVWLGNKIDLIPILNVFEMKPWDHLCSSDGLSYVNFNIDVFQVDEELYVISYKKDVTT